jgi:hypothetical protein
LQIPGLAKRGAAQNYKGMPPRSEKRFNPKASLFPLARPRPPCLPTTPSRSNQRPIIAPKPLDLPSRPPQPRQPRPSQQVILPASPPSRRPHLEPRSSSGRDRLIQQMPSISGAPYLLPQIDSLVQFHELLAASQILPDLLGGVVNLVCMGCKMLVDSLPNGPPRLNGPQAHPKPSKLCQTF